MIYTILGKLNRNKDHKKTLLLLHFLKSYERVNKPGDSEVEEWYSLFPESQTIDPLSNWRMPFTPTLFSTDIWKIIRPELNLQTYNTWFEVVPILDKILNANEICSFVIKDIVRQINKYLFEINNKCFRLRQEFYRNMPQINGRYIRHLVTYSNKSISVYGT